MATRAFRLDMKSPLHVGEVGVGQEETLEYVPSDTLFAALVMAWLEMGRYELVADLPSWHEKPPPLLLTSAFPYLGETYLFPRPRLLLQPQDGGKAYKKVRWLSGSIFHSLLATPAQDNLDELWRQRTLLGNGAIWATKDEILAAEDGWGFMRVPKVAVDRVGNASALFHVGRVHFSHGAGLWFTVQGEEEWLDAVSEALDFLADSGIGGQRSRGNGQFVPTPVTSPIKSTTVSPNAAYQVLLSRTAPASEHMSFLSRPSSSYHLVTVGGWATMPGDHPLIRKRVRMLAEGSIVERNPIGQLVDVNPAPQLVDHPIYRCGVGFGVPIALPKDWKDSQEGGAK